MSDCPYERMMSETKNARKLGLGKQILEIVAQRKYISAMCTPTRTVASTVLMLEKKI